MGCVHHLNLAHPMMPLVFCCFLMFFGASDDAIVQDTSKMEHTVDIPNLFGSLVRAAVGRP